MRQTFPAISVLAVVVVAAVPASARTARRPARSAGVSRLAAALRPERPAASPKITRLAILPAEITLDGPHAAHYLLVMGTLADGSQVDLTSRARLLMSAPGVAELEVGARVRSVADGNALVTAVVDGVKASVPVRVSNSSRPYRVSFRHDVVPVLSKLGCSQGACHGAAAGKGGFKLTLRGDVPAEDYPAIVQEFKGRRLSRLVPEKSLLLLKATSEVPHGGGHRTRKGSPEYSVLLGWIRQGAPGLDKDEPQLQAAEILPGDRVMKPGQGQRMVVRARYSDGRVRDVTDWAIYKSNDEGTATIGEDGALRVVREGDTAVFANYMGQLAVARVTVPFAKPVPAAAYSQRSNRIDDLVYGKLRQLRIEPSSVCSDAEFIRRAYIDLIGTLPTPEETRRFLAECEAERSSGVGRSASGIRETPTPTLPNPHTPIPAPKARFRLIDSLLERPEYVDLWTLRWADLLQIRRANFEMDGVKHFRQWLWESVKADKPWNQLAREVVTAVGSGKENPPAYFFVDKSEDRGDRTRSPEASAEEISQIFLGTRIQCAKCHNHPTERYSQDDYWSMAAFFSQLKPLREKDKLPHGIQLDLKGEVKVARRGTVAKPRPLDRTELPVAPDQDRRAALAEWLTSPKNEQFAWALVNRLWARFFSVGIIEPTDDIRSTNPPTNDALLRGLAEELVKGGYRLKPLMRLIMTSRTYQASLEAKPSNRTDLKFFSRYYPRRMAAEELLDAISQVTGVGETFPDMPAGTRAIQLPDPEYASNFLDTFGRPRRETVCDCERSNTPTMPQALALMNGDAIYGRIRSEKGLLAGLLKAGKTDPEIIEELYLACFSRKPTPAELKALGPALKAQGSREEGLQDLFWALINSKEFQFNH